MPKPSKIDEYIDRTNHEPAIEKKPDLTMEDMNEDFIDDSSEIPDPEPIITIKESNFAIRGDIAIVGGLPKTGKTSICAFMLATSLMPEIPENFDSLGIRVSYCQGKPLVYIDTEQPKAYTNKLRKQILRMASLPQDSELENLHIYNLRKCSSDDKIKIILALMNEYPDTHLWIIDGAADLIQDPNDTKQSFGLIETMMVKSDELNTAIVLHIHQNPGGAKLRGNLGSEAERKCGGAIYVTKDKNTQVHAINPGVIRGTADFEPIYFRWDNDEKRMVSLESEEVEELKKQGGNSSTKKLGQKFEEYLNLVFKDESSLPSPEIVSRIELYAKEIEGKEIKVRTAQRRLSSMRELGYITMLDSGEYQINREVFGFA